MTRQACIIQQLGVDLGLRTLFQHLDFQLPYAQCTGLVGRNGQGKSILLRLLSQSTDLAYQGQISWQCPIAYLPQLQRLTGLTIAEALEVNDLADAFMRIEQGIASFIDYELVEDQWHLPPQWQQLLEQAQLPIMLDYPVTQLSEGQKTRLALCRLFLLKQHYLLLDEPSNHLDHNSRQWLMDCIQAHPAGCLVVSHDRDLLNEMQHILWLNEFGIEHYTGNYANYHMQATLQREALEKSIEQDKRDSKQLAIQQHHTLMKNQKRQTVAKKHRETGSQAKILLDFKKEQAGQHTGQLVQQQQRQLQQVRSALSDKQYMLEKIKPQQFEFPETHSKTGEILRLTAVAHPFMAETTFNFALQAQEKIHLSGENGSGKSTLLKLIAADHKPTSTSIGVFKNAHSFYLDQNFSFLRFEDSALDNLLRLNPQHTAEQWRNLLGQMRLRGDKSLQPLSQLSGGEQLKVALVTIANPATPFDLLLLDEPENHLDIESRELLAHAIRSFRGTVILVSHDDSFVEECEIDDHLSIHHLMHKQEH